jgi:hypothetical protein
MIPELRREFNANFTEQKYGEFLRRLDAGCGTPVEFRNSETPCFFPAELMAQMATYGQELIAQLMGDPAYLAAAGATIPAAYCMPNENPTPLFIQVDFGLDQELQPKLVEIQGFPSLYAYQPFLADTYREVYGLDPALKTLFGGLDADAYRQLLRRAIVGDHAPENVALLEIHPQQQKTLCDFLLTERLCGIRTVCLTEVEKQGNRLYYRHEGRQIPIERIYNRVIVDELVRKSIQPPFDYRDELAVEWAGHPNWYYIISKFSLPYLHHPCVPSTRFLHQIEALPADLENYVLKPLYSFAGHGVIVGPTHAQVEQAAAVADPSQMILQERVDFAAPIQTPHGPTKAEIRIMYLWQNEGPQAVTALVRTGRGQQMGVDHNRNLSWVGASAAFIA